MWITETVQVTDLGRSLWKELVDGEIGKDSLWPETNKGESRAKAER